MLSVIIPVYKVEKYLQTCIDSVVGQTYKDIEIILVDDGSPDGCGKICDEYALKDNRIKVVHKENGGLSDARNAGLEVAKGDYITFVDSDDYIHPKMYEFMMALFKGDVSLVMCPFKNVKEDENDRCDELYYDARVLYHDEIVSRMFSDEYAQFVVAWNKIYKKDLWGDMRYPVGRIHEDEFTTYKCLYKAAAVGYACDAMYYYRERGGSIMSSFNEKACLDNVDALMEKIDFFKDKGTTELGLCVSRSLETVIYYYDRARENDRIQTADVIRSRFIQVWTDLCKNYKFDIKKERRLYFNCFVKGENRIKKVMPVYWKMEGFTRRVDNKKNSVARSIAGRAGVLSKKNPDIASIEVTLDKIYTEHLSVSRFGDGEFKWMAQIPNVTFEGNSPVMAARLKEIAVSDRPGHIVCMTDVFGSLSKYTKEARDFWYDFLGEYRQTWIGLLKEGKQYYNTNITRPYMDYKDKSVCENRFNLLKRIWQGRDVVIIEGEKSRLGTGNDLFDGAKSIRRILAPVRNAFSMYDEILESAKKIEDKSVLFIIALGPTATILAYDLAGLGYQAIDAGHMDVEYEWFKMGATKKVAIENKYVNEVNAGFGVGELKDEVYQSQIIDVIKRTKQ